MKITYFGVHPEDFDYSTYEKKLQEITSIKLTYINQLQSSDENQIENSFIKLAQAYFREIELLLKEMSEEV